MLILYLLDMNIIITIIIKNYRWDGASEDKVSTGWNCQRGDHREKQLLETRLIVIGENGA